MPYLVHVTPFSPGHLWLGFCLPEKSLVSSRVASLLAMFNWGT